MHWYPLGTYFEILDGVGEAQIVKVKHVLDPEELCHLLNLPLRLLLQTAQLKLQLLQTERDI